MQNIKEFLEHFSNLYDSVKQDLTWREQFNETKIKIVNLKKDNKWVKYNTKIAERIVVFYKQALYWFAEQWNNNKCQSITFSKDIRYQL